LLPASLPQGGYMRPTLCAGIIYRTEAQATRRAGTVFAPSGVIIRSCSRATPRSFCLAGH
ncbi:MAG: hypothetical protein ABW158_08155, partial [Candidatus Thiodiazotropha sp. 6PDIVS]